MSEARPASSALKDWVRALEATASLNGAPTVTLPTLINDLAASFGDAPALLSDRQSLTYRELAARANRYARWALAHGIHSGDVVCLLMPDTPEYVAVWLGLTRVGAVVALINTNISGEALAHAIKTAAPVGMIVGGTFQDRLPELTPWLPTRPHYWVHGNGTAGSLEVDLVRYADTGLEPAECPLPRLRDRALLIYTSGTTGLPKAANVSHHRIMQWCFWFAGLLDTSPNDRMYNCLPLQHSVGGIVAVGALLVRGGSVVLPGRFSASRFWDDIVRWECTLFQYIGELCRYLLNSPPHPQETSHKLRMCVGNGLAPEVWRPLQARFKLPRILEFYAATEGSFSLYNVEGEPGAIGRIPGFLRHRFPVAIVRFDVERGEPERGADGLCIRCSANETGEALGKLGDTAGRFEGYTDPDASERKILRNVLAPGDAWFRTGDLMRRDASGFFYFMDRIGDTFRWKGENVSTTEVAGIIASCPGVKEAVVYGVKVPGADGRAGMAALTTSADFDVAALRQHLGDGLPDYARPVFLRLRSEIDATATFKPKKQELMAQGFDPTATTDALYIDDRSRQAYLPLDAAAFARVTAGEARL
ncbi:MAG: long-chain-acyl-CoA synthetase [Alphaproteobacteria bacterium]|nr:long-chain-acyl-CoA synthetase [Alphaproteobacteria bacterium]